MPIKVKQSEGCLPAVSNTRRARVCVLMLNYRCRLGLLLCYGVLADVCVFIPSGLCLPGNHLHFSLSLLHSQPIRVFILWKDWNITEFQSFVTVPRELTVPLQFIKCSVYHTKITPHDFTGQCIYLQWIHTDNCFPLSPCVCCSCLSLPVVLTPLYFQ